MNKAFEIGSIVKLDKEQIRRCGHDGEWTHTDESYIISKILKVSPDGYNLIELDRKIDGYKTINTFYLRLLNNKEIRKEKLIKINEIRR